MSPRSKLALVENYCERKGRLVVFFLVPSLASLPPSQVSFQEWIWAGSGSHLCPRAPTVTDVQEDWLQSLALAVERFYLEVT